MDKWEYKKIQCCSEEEMNKLGQQGWELAFMPKYNDFPSYIFKRKIESPSQSTSITPQMIRDLTLAIRSLQPQKPQQQPSAPKAQQKAEPETPKWFSDLMQSR